MNLVEFVPLHPQNALSRLTEALDKLAATEILHLELEVVHGHGISSRMAIIAPEL